MQEEVHWAESVFIARASEHGLPMSKPWGDSHSLPFWNCGQSPASKLLEIKILTASDCDSRSFSPLQANSMIPTYRGRGTRHASPLQILNYTISKFPN